MKNRVLSVLYTIAVFLFILSFSIGLPIYFRPFYYAHIHGLDLSEQSGYSEQEIKEAYDAVLDYLTLPGCEFSTGVMRHSVEGASHFADCKALFDLNAAVLLTSSICVLALCLWRKMSKSEPYRLGRYAASFWSAVAAVFVPLILGILVSLDFPRAFALFHSLFFPGKENWLFDPQTDPIIRVLPMEFFMHCAILIGLSIVVISATVLLKELTRLKRHPV